MKTSLVLLLSFLLAQDPKSLEERVLGKWQGMRGDEPIEFEVFKDKTAKVWRDGEPALVKYRWTDATHAVIDTTEVVVELKDGALILTDKEKRSLRFTRPPDLDAAPPKIATPREFFERRKKALEKEDYALVWSTYSKRYHEKMAEFAAQMGRLDRQELREIGFARSREAIEPRELAFKLCEMICKFPGKDLILADAKEEGEKATLKVTIRVSSTTVIRTLALVKANGTWSEDWSEELEAGMKAGILNVKKTECHNNLLQLWKMQNNYMVQFGGRRKIMPQETGGDFWLALSKTKPPLIDETLDGIYACPFKAAAHKKGTTDYRGPAEDVGTLKDDDIVGACLDNHPDGSGTVLLKSGEIKEVKKGDELYKKALEKTKP